ncbi:hypothetical protein KBD34_05525 [Patescibacteria group bacterium]|nr:hypothetical protein [Patescibacteria group bacterium]
MNVDGLKHLRFTIFAATVLAAQRFNRLNAKSRQNYGCFYNPESGQTCPVEGVTSVCLPALNSRALVADGGVILQQMADYFSHATDFAEGVTDVYVYAVEGRVLMLAAALLREPSEEAIATIARTLRQNRLVVIEDGRLLPEVA